MYHRDMGRKHVINFEIPGNPIAQQRHRTMIKYGKRINHNPNANQKASLKKWIHAEMHNRSLNMLEGPVSVQMIFHIAIPHSYSKKRRDEAIGKPCPLRPDIDNYCKFYLDALNDLVYNDDNQVTKIECRKLYAIESKTVIWCIEDNIADKITT